MGRPLLFLLNEEEDEARGTSKVCGVSLLEFLAFTFTALPAPDPVAEVSVTARSSSRGAPSLAAAPREAPPGSCSSVSSRDDGGVAGAVGGAGLERTLYSRRGMVWWCSRVITP